MMHFQFSKIAWKRALLAGIAITLLTTMLVFLIIGVYAMALAVQAQGAPDETQIEVFANQIGQWGVLVITVVLTVAIAARLGRGIAEAPQLNGIAVGSVAALTGLLMGMILGGTLSVGALTTFVLTIAAGWLGGALSARKK